MCPNITFFFRSTQLMIFDTSEMVLFQRVRYIFFPQSITIDESYLGNFYFFEMTNFLFFYDVLTQKCTILVHTKKKCSVASPNGVVLIFYFTGLYAANFVSWFRILLHPSVITVMATTLSQVVFMINRVDS